MTNEFDNPAPPDIVLREALNEPSPRQLDDYIDAICELKNKRFTFREIAEWLKQYGIEADHNAVYRAYSKTVSDYEAHLVAEHDKEVEENESYRDALLNDRVTHVAHSSGQTAGPEQVEKLAKKTVKAKNPRRKK